MSFLKQYNIELTCVGPVHIGSGYQIEKKEYIQLNDSEIAVLDLSKLYSIAKKNGHADDFEKFVMTNFQESFISFCQDGYISGDELKSCIKYTLDCSDYIEDRESRTQLAIDSCVKDAYGLPYVPGSSIKGVLRTALLVADLVADPDKYGKLGDMIYDFLDSNKKVKRNQLLKRETDNLENYFFNILDNDKKHKHNAVNDFMKAVIVSDSDPLSLDDLTLSPTVEIDETGRESSLNKMRESLKPGSKISFTLTIDTSVLKNKNVNLDIEDIKKAISYYSSDLNEFFFSHFNKLDNMKDNQVVLGAGGGFASKTVLYSLLGQDDGVYAASKVFEKTNVPREHGHYNDVNRNVSPHIIKSTYYHGTLLKMGLCDFKIL